MKREYCIAGNWKLNFTPSEATTFANQLKNEFSGISHTIMVAPSFVCIPQVKEALKGTNIKLLAQNVATKESGALTGEVSITMLKELVDGVIIGHSERRTIFKETDSEINTKVQLTLKHGLKAILCVGETLEERENSALWKVIGHQLTEGLSLISKEDMKNVIIAYEPVWAIGTGKTASPQDAQEVHAFIRKEIAKLYSSEVASSLIIQYGGSVKPSNAKELMGMEDIDGALVGGASLVVSDFLGIAKFDK